MRLKSGFSDPAFASGGMSEFDRAVEIGAKALYEFDPQLNVGKPIAIILDGKVLSAPHVNEPILGGSAQISGNFTVDSANQLAIALRSGALRMASQAMALSRWVLPKP